MPTVAWNKSWGENFYRHLAASGDAPFGNQWGDPTITDWEYLFQRYILRRNIPGNLSRVVKRYIDPYLTPGSVAMEIGPGGGRWTQFLLKAQSLWLVDLNTEFFPYLQDRYQAYAHHFDFYQTSGTELNDIDTRSIDFIFTFNVLVHLDPDDIKAYLAEIYRVLKPDGYAVLHYADKTKNAARRDPDFSDMNADLMDYFADKNYFDILEHDTSLLNHSNIIVLQK